MKYILSESKLFSIIDKFFKKYYKEPLIMYETDDTPKYLYFVLESDLENFVKAYKKDPTDYEFYLSYVKFHRNSLGKLWVEDWDFIDHLNLILPSSIEEKKDILLSYFSEKYNEYFIDMQLDEDDW